MRAERRLELVDRVARGARPQQLRSPARAAVAVLMVDASGQTQHPGAVGGAVAAKVLWDGAEELLSAGEIAEWRLVHPDRLVTAAGADDERGNAGRVVNGSPGFR